MTEPDRGVRARADSQPEPDPETSPEPYEDPPQPAPSSSSSVTHSALFVILLSGYQILPDDPVAETAFIFMLALLGGLMARSYIKGDPEQERQQRRVLRTAKIRELEKELNMKPMELWSDEDPDIVAAPPKEERRD